MKYILCFITLIWLFLLLNINLSASPNGIYIIRAVIDNKVFVERIIKQ